jgi:nucleoside-diphosphate-sugar epimerase
MKALVTGSGGFIGHHLVKRLKKEGFRVRGADLKMPEFEPTEADEFLVTDLRSEANCRKAVDECDWVYHLAADMGGIGYIETHKAEIVRNNTRIDLGMLEAARRAKVKMFFYASSACVYPDYKQNQTDVPPLREEDAYPAMPEPGYGWEKLYAELMCRYCREDFGLETRVARFHNIYGPLGTWEGGREKSPAAICRKVALAKDGDEIEVWGDGCQTRSYCYVSDCVEGIFCLSRSDYREPLNIGRDDVISIDAMVDLVAGIAGKKVRIRHDLSKPVGVRGRNADVTKMKKVLGWSPGTTMQSGFKVTYDWIAGQLKKAGRIS